MEYIFLGLAGMAGGVIGYLVGQRRARQEFLFNDSVDVSPALQSAQQAIHERTEKRLARIMGVARGDGRITNDGVEELFCISNRTASSYLRILSERGELQRQGIGRGTYYVPSQNQP